MNRIEIGQEFVFVQPAEVDGHKIAAGTRVRVGLVEDEVMDEARITVVVHDTNPPQTLTLPRHVLTLHARRT